MKRLFVVTLLALCPSLASPDNLIEIDVPHIPETRIALRSDSFEPTQISDLQMRPPVTFVCGGVVGISMDHESVAPMARLSNAKLVYYHGEYIFGRNPWIQVHTLSFVQ